MAIKSRAIVPVKQAIPEILPVLPLPGIVAFPLTIIPLVIDEAHAIRLVTDAMRDDRLVALVAQQTMTKEQIGPDDLHKIGTVVTIEKLTHAKDGTIRLVVHGLKRIRFIKFTATDPYFIARVKSHPELLEVEKLELEGLRHAILNVLRRLISLIDELPKELLTAAESLNDICHFAYLVALTTPISTIARQELLEIDSIDVKLRRLLELLQHEITVREIGQKITLETRERMSKARREYFLREQMRAIQNQLGDASEQPEVTRLRKKIAAANLPAEALREAEKELARLAMLSPGSTELDIVYTYLDWLASLPWNKFTGSNIDIQHTHKVLDKAHYGLEKIKERILEYLAVKKLHQERQLSNQMKVNQPESSFIDDNDAKNPITIQEPILCFVGPPGVGKTSLGLSIAQALGRKFVCLSLGGTHDEAEIRGHRRTYIGAMPGKIIKGIKQAEACDPVIMLDEIDKISSSVQGDPASALLEILDPEQNHHFVDNYLGVPFSLKNVLFLVTANTLDTIPAPLLDRLEIIRLAGYTDTEKASIAEQYLIPKQVAAHSLNSSELVVNAQVIRHITRNYTREAGVRNLEREIAKICRKISRTIAEGHKPLARITTQLVENYLGRPRFFDEIAERTEYPGVATGLAWTPTGGEMLFVEATLIPSREERLILTGMLGDVMRESAQAALSYVRANTFLFNSKPELFEGKTIHLHVPAGAIPKDGPSAGITIATALASLLSNQPVKNDIAMTGEITLRGKVLPVGGIKEKVLAAHRSGIKSIILPRHNERDLEDVPTELHQALTFIFVDTVEEVLHHALATENILSPMQSMKRMVHNQSSMLVKSPEK